MSDFFAIQLDYIYFLYGLGFVLLGVSIRPMKHQDSAFPWQWLSLFGLLHGVKEWGDLLALSVGDSPVLHGLRAVLTWWSFAALVMFARQGLSSVLGRNIPVALTALLAVLPLAGLAWGISGLEAGVRFLLALPGGFAAAAYLALYGAKQPKGRGLLFCAALALAFYTLLGLALWQTQLAQSLPGVGNWFAAMSSLPPQVWKAACAGTLCLCVWNFLLVRSRQAEQPFWNTNFWGRRIFLFLALLTVLTSGWLATQYAGLQGLAGEAARSENHFKMVRDNLAQFMSTADRVARALAVSPVLRRTADGTALNTEECNAEMDRFAAIIPGAVAYFVDVFGETLAASNRQEITSFVGQNFAFREYFTRALSTGSANEVAVGAISYLPGYYSAVRVMSPAGRVLGVVVVKVDLTVLDLGNHRNGPAFLANRYGVVLAANSGAYVLHQLWPAHPADIRALLDSRTVPRVLDPLLDEPPLHGATGIFMGGKRLVSRMDTELYGLELIRFDPLTPIWLPRLLVICITLLFSLLLLVLFINQESLRSSGAQLAASERRYRRIFEESTAIQLLVDPVQGSIVDANAAAVAFYGYPREALKHMSLESLSAEPAPEGGARQESRQLQERSFITRHRLSGGRVRVMETHASPVAGRDTLYTFILQDVTERELAGETLRESERRFRALASKAPVGIFQMDAAGQCVYANEYWCAFMGLTPEEATGPGWLAPLVPEDMERLENQWQQGMGTGKPFTFEARIKRADGSLAWGEGHVEPVHDGLGVVSGYIGTVADVTGRRAAQEQLRDYVERLAQRNQELDEAVVRAEEAAKAKSMFLANMSHEIRTPLNGVLGMLTDLSESGLAPGQAQAVQVALEAGRNLLHVVGDILDFSKIEAGKMEFRREPMELRPVVEAVLQAFTPEAALKGLSLSAVFSPDVPQAMLGDAVRLRQVLYNLVGNSMKFTSEGGVTLTVSRDTGDGRNLLIVVRDTGEGIPADKLAEVFEAFTQADSSSTRAHSGTGLGLAIVRSLVRGMGGDITLQSETGKGSTATVTLACDPCAAPGKKQDTGGPGAPQDTRPLDILLVEDDRINQITAKRFLDKWGHTVTVAANGQEALDILAARRFDIVLLDMQMPVLDGISTLRALRGGQSGVYAHTAGMPVVALTAHAMKGDRERYLAEGFDAYLAKPFDVPEIKRVLAWAGARPAAAPDPGAPDAGNAGATGKA